MELLDRGDLALLIELTNGRRRMSPFFNDIQRAARFSGVEVEALAHYIAATSVAATEAFTAMMAEEGAAKFDIEEHRKMAAAASLILVWEVAFEAGRLVERRIQERER